MRPRPQVSGMLLERYRQSCTMPCVTSLLIVLFRPQQSAHVEGWAVASMGTDVGPTARWSCESTSRSPSMRGAASAPSQLKNCR